jgi:hypothetical protein
MTPAERLVVEAAIRHIEEATYCDGPGDLIAAVKALDVERAPLPVNELERTWAEVVTEDEIFSARTGKWYRVIEAHRQGGRMAVHAKGLPKIIKPLATDPVRIRRSTMGDAVDVMISVFSSGPSYVEAVAEDTLKPKTESEE